MDDYQRIFRLASILLQYPDKEWMDTEEFYEEIGMIENKLVKILYKEFMNYLVDVPYFELCKTYTQTFDFSDKTTLYLTYPVFGENIDRGKGLLKLKDEFSGAGFPLESDELPDYFPLILEFCSLAPIEAVHKMLLIHRKAIDQLLKELTLAENPYQFILQGCIQEIETILSNQKAS
ncbi:nitrate reductase molybdenum cofactor assembly chaperone [Neobacillus sp. PS3-40]|uniref:nitrate reductase molybdenum cofactor assembly chaperone n=1 Tax=Neobacillus sp. PS3-40 TaxID=3070679 RepID=UPI0027DF03F6|nr:nitrate reductase molybdenum cofactor assembly chaperone [Neobacillus sp. PS3-40]WML44919.1 nitrate reductase molybdenum cofactor assembly chaperone [Neobacillus sp. PS3-40]